MYERRAENSDQTVHIARADAEIDRIPAHHPGDEPRKPDADEQRGRTDSRVRDAFTVALNGSGAGLRKRGCDLHRLSVGAVESVTRLRRTQVRYHLRMTNPLIHLKTERRSTHPWIFQKMVEKPEPRPKPGSVVEIIDREGNIRRPRLLQRPFAHRTCACLRPIRTRRSTRRSSRARSAKRCRCAATCSSSMRVTDA